MKSILKLLFAIIAATLLSSCNHMRHNVIDESVESDSTELYEYPHVPTVYDVLEERESLKYALWCDSVYLAMPEQILTHLLVTKGTTQSILEIVEDYIANKQFYHDTILNAMNVQKKYIPDSLPKSNIPNRALKSVDTIPTYEK